MEVNLASQTHQAPHVGLPQIDPVITAVAENNKESAMELLKDAQKVLDSTAAKKVIHKNAAARTKSRLVKAVKELS